VQSGEANGNSPFCLLPSLVADICVNDDMSRMTGCEAHNALCASGSVVAQCVAGSPNLPTTFGTKNDIDVSRVLWWTLPGCRCACKAASGNLRLAGMEAEAGAPIF
jgi:hypothetical protein